MTTSTIGQVLYEAEISVFAMYVTAAPWAELPGPHRQQYEDAARAVAAVVREQCAQACERARLFHPLAGGWAAGMDDGVAVCVAAIRSMK